MIRSTRESGDSVESNIVWNYGHLTIPRHLRDIVVTEYGIADLRGKSDAKVIASMIEIADSRFQDDLIEQAKDAKKLPQDWDLPAQYRDNYPATLEDSLGPFRDRGVLPRFPYGTEINDEERTLAETLQNLESMVENRELEAVLDSAVLLDVVRIPEAALPYLERMGLASPSTLRERLQRRLVVFALAKNGIL
jgi:hypothetical protein